MNIFLIKMYHFPLPFLTPSIMFLDGAAFFMQFWSSLSTGCTFHTVWLFDVLHGLEILEIVNWICLEVYK